MELGFHRMKAENLLSMLDAASVQAVTLDPPFNVTELAEGEHVIGGFEDRRGFRRDMGEWDKEYNPVKTVLWSARALEPGGWFIAKTGDRTIGLYRDLLSADHSTTRAYLDFFFQQDVLSANEYTEALRYLESRPRPTPLFEYKATVTWIKPNPPTRIRKTTYRSACEWFCVAKRLDDDGESVPPIYWDFSSQGAMKNWFEHPICAGAERLYWHIVDPVMRDGRVEGSGIIPCKSKNACPICVEGRTMGLQDEDLPLHLQRRHHPTQTPIAVWDWLFRRHVGKEMTVVDSYAGTSTTALSARKRRAKWIGCDADWEFARVSEMRLSGEWAGNLHVQSNGVEQLGFKP